MSNKIYRKRQPHDQRHKTTQTMNVIFAPTTTY